jgi:hypothetical protein
MRNTEVFYHLFIPLNDAFRTWTWWVDEQLGLIKSSKLVDVAKVNMAITMPKYCVVDPNHPVEFWMNVANYIQTRYPFVNILDIRDTSDVNLYEGQTLRFVHQACQERDMDVVYIHSKGGISNTAHVASWRQILNHFTIAEWPTCLKQLATHDVVGIKDRICTDKSVTGNFWWSKSEYIRTLPEPLNSTVYNTDPNKHPDGGAYRYTFEDWVFVNNPSIHHVIDTNASHYQEYCFLENLIKK